MTPRSVLRSGPDDADRVDGVGGAVVVGKHAGVVAVQVAAFALEVDEVAPAGVAADRAVDRLVSPASVMVPTVGRSDLGMDALQDVLAC